ncbi:MAG: ABC transporter ATP-binding protein [Oscillospiraceae bacterium]|nr:ABC transporter ATP-binding protein [Oscillospiraceae bacterium]
MMTLKGTIKKFGDFNALDGVDLEIPKGTAFGLLGSNGAGKSTILRLFSGIYRPDGGEVLIDGEPVYDNVSAKQKVFFINDETVQFGGYTLMELKNLYKQFYPSFSEEIFARLQGAIQLPAHRKISTYSKGMKRQAIVIIGIACCTPYLLLDEAFDGLDPTMRIIVKRMLVDAMCERELTVVISSHNLKEINELCDTAALLHKGKIIFNRQIDSLKGSVHKVQVVFSDREKQYTPEDFTDFPDILHFSQNHSIYHIIAKGDEATIRKALEPYKPIVADLIPLSLEEIFIYELEVLGYDSQVFA